MKMIFGIVGLIGVVLWLTGSMAVPMGKAMGTLNVVLPEEMQQPTEPLRRQRASGSNSSRHGKST